jgi:hypothetical protein
MKSTRPPLLPDPVGVVITRGKSGGQVRAVQRACRSGRCSRVAAGVYVFAVDQQRQASLVRQDWLSVAVALAPGAVISHRSALNPDGVPADGLVLSHPTRFNRTIQVPGLRISLVRGPSAQADDEPLAAGALYRSSVPRMLLENLGRRRGDGGRVLGEPAVRARLAAILDAEGPARLHAIGRRAAELAADAGLEGALARLQAILERLAGPALPELAPDAASADGQSAMEARADADPACMALLQAVASRLRSMPLQPRGARALREPARAHLAFVESYFDSSASAYGVSIEQARDAVFSGGEVSIGSPLTGELAAAFNLSRHSPLSDTVPPFGPGFAQSLRARHEMLMQSSPQAEPGRLRSRPIDADRGLADPALIRGTLAAASQLALSVPEGLARAAFYSLMLWCIQPFEHGVERLARLVSNAELASVGQARILLPACLRQRLADAREQIRIAKGAGDAVRAFVGLLESLQRWSAALDGTRLDTLIESMRRAGALQFRCSDAEADALLSRP